MEENPQPTPQDISRWAVEYLKEAALEKKAAREVGNQKPSRLARFGKWWTNYGASIATMITIIAVPVGAVWTVKLYVDQQKREVQQREKEVVQQEKDAELRKQSLVIQFSSELGDKAKRNAAAYALAVLAKQDAVAILKAHLRESAKSGEDASFRDAIIDALVTIGPASFIPMIEMNRQANSETENPAHVIAIIEATQTVILRLIRKDPKYLTVQILDFNGVTFRKADLGFLNFAGQNLANAHFADTSLCNTDLNGANLTGAHFTGTTQLSGANLSGANLEKADFSGPPTISLEGVNLKNATGVEADFSDSNMSNAQLQGAMLTKSNFTRTILESANLSEAWLAECAFSRANLFGAKLIGAELAGASFQGANLQNADFSEAKLRGASFFYFPDEKPHAPDQPGPSYAALVNDASFYFAKNMSNDTRVYLCKWGAVKVPDTCEGIPPEKFEYRYKPSGAGSSCY